MSPNTLLFYRRRRYAVVDKLNGFSLMTSQASNKGFTETKFVKKVNYLNVDFCSCVAYLQEKQKSQSKSWAKNYLGTPLWRHTERYTHFLMPDYKTNGEDGFTVKKQNATIITSAAIHN